MTHGLALLAAQPMLVQHFTKRDLRFMALVQAIADGLTAREAATRAGVPLQSAYNFAKVRGLHFATAKRGPKGVSSEVAERRAKVLALRAQGKTLEEVAKDFGVTRERIRQILVKAGGDPMPIAVKMHSIPRTRCGECGATFNNAHGLRAGSNRRVCSAGCVEAWKKRRHEERLTRYLSGVSAKKAFHALHLRAAGKTWREVAEVTGQRKPEISVMNVRHFERRTGVDCSWAFIGLGRWANKKPSAPQCFFDHRYLKIIGEAA